MRVGVITFPGTLDDVDAVRAVRLAGGEPVHLWHADHDLRGVDALVVPGGFSYGDYLRAGAIAARAPIMDEVVAAADRGMPVLGICNGFQILCEAGLLPGALTRNAGLHFVCRDLRLRVESAATAWTGSFRRRLRRSSCRSSPARAATSPTPPLAAARARRPRRLPVRGCVAPNGSMGSTSPGSLRRTAGSRGSRRPGARDRPSDRALRRTVSACSPSVLAAVASAYSPPSSGTARTAGSLGTPLGWTQSGVGVRRHGGPETRRPASFVLRHSGCARVGGRLCADAVPVR